MLNPKKRVKAKKIIRIAPAKLISMIVLFFMLYSPLCVLHIVLQDRHNSDGASPWF